MGKKERELFKALCNWDQGNMNEAMVSEASPSVLGLLFFNRMQGIAYEVLKKTQLLHAVPREFRTSLAAAYEQNLLKNQSFFACVQMVSDLLSQIDSKVALLKGAYLCAYYPPGCRTSNDIDLLVLSRDVTRIGNYLKANGFRQGKIVNEEFVPATRKEIVESKMLRGETVPYIKEINYPYMKFLELDVNFSLDYKNNASDLVENMLKNSCNRTVKHLTIPTLDETDFFIHLCAHLYKEATTYPWIKMKRDMTLYKFYDIFLLLSDMSREQFRLVFERARRLNLVNVCAYAVLTTMELFSMNNLYMKGMAEAEITGEKKFLYQVVSPRNKKIYEYKTTNAEERFFLENRLQDLREVCPYEGTEYEKA